MNNAIMNPLSWVKNALNAWMATVKTHWASPDYCSKAMALLVAIGGLIGIVLVAQLAIALLPLVILAAFIEVVALHMRRN